MKKNIRTNIDLIKKKYIYITNQNIKQYIIIHIKKINPASKKIFARISIMKKNWNKY
jgi:hypothetical protein